MRHISTKCVPVQAAQSMSIVERYHVPVRRSLFIIEKEAPNTDNVDVLRMAVKAMNETVGPDGLVPMLLVNSVLLLLGLPNDSPNPSTHRRAVAF